MVASNMKLINILDEYDEEISLQQKLMGDKNILVQERDEIIRRNYMLLQEKNMTIEDQRKIIQQKNEIIEQMDHIVQQKDAELQIHPWIVEAREVNLTNEKIGGGAYGEVKVGIFRGIRVAAKCLHELIVSRHNRKYFFKRNGDIL